MKQMKTLMMACLLAVAGAATAQDDIVDAARKTNDYFMAKYADPTQPTNVKRIRPSSLWTRAVYYEGLMALYRIDPQERYLDYTRRWADFHRWTPRNGTKTVHADDQCCEQTYVEYLLTTDPSLRADDPRLDSVRTNLERQMATRRVDYWTWIDAIQMAMPVYIKMYSVGGDRRYLDYAMQAYTWTRDTCGGGLFNTKEGLWWRDKDYVPPYQESDGRNCYWSRGNGWVYAALVRSMELLPRGSREYKRLSRDFTAMSRALLGCQRADGYWNVSLVSPVTYGGPEMTGTALFLYGMSWGLSNGLLKGRRYHAACDRAWKALAACVHDSGFLGYNQGTGKDPSAGQPVTFTSVPDFEDYGTGCFLLGATEYWKMKTGGQAEAGARPTEAKAGTRWWWPGSAVDAENLRWNLAEYARAGIGSVEITPIYGVQGNGANELPFLSPEWMNALKTVTDEARRVGILVDMNCGTGWPFGGPLTPIDEAACKAVFIVDTVAAGAAPAKTLPPKEKDYARLVCERRYALDGQEPVGKTARRQAVRQELVIQLYQSRTRQKVKRAAPGGEGWVVDHFDREAVAHYLGRFDQAFASTRTPFPHHFFNDSYEVYGANWTPTLLDEFAARRGYRLEDRLRELLGLVDDGNQVLSDYRETLSDLLLENFSQQWTAWAHGHGAATRNQAHGSPANLIDVYASVDVPEIEGFGLSELGIKGLRTDPGMTKKNFSDVSMLKYASSAAHITGKPLTSSETFTWLTEHFRTSLSQMKPDLDLMFTCGVNHMFFHGTCYSPKDDPWPGWKFYASIDMSPTNSVWRDAPYLMDYIERSQRFLQWGRPDNDFLVYLPVRDMWHQRLAEGEKGLLMQFDIHSMDKKAPDFIRSILEIDSLGYDCDYISDRYLMTTTCRDGKLVTAGGTSYQALVVPGSGNLPASLRNHLDSLQRQGAGIIWGVDAPRMTAAAKAEPMRNRLHLRAIRRTNDGGHHYFIANLTPDDVDALVPLAVPCRSAQWFNPLDGTSQPAALADGLVRITLRSGESRILVVNANRNDNYIPQTTNRPNAQSPKRPIPQTTQRPIDLTANTWTLSFLESAPKVEKTFLLNGLRTWEGLDDDSVSVTMGTGVYTTTFSLDRRQARQHWQLELGDVRESARVYLNGEPVGCAWSVPFILDCQDKLRKGKNEIRIEVTNLPANRIADLDRRGVAWRKFNEINVVNLNYKHDTYEDWAPVPSGLNGTVRLIPCSSSSPQQ